VKKHTHVKPLLIFLILLLVTSPALMARAADRKVLDTIQIPSIGYQMLNDKSAQNCRLNHQCALQFNGENQWVYLDKFHGFDTAAFTIETWFNWTGAGIPVPANLGSFSNGIPFIAIGDGEGSASQTDANLFFGIQASSGKIMAVFREAASDSSSTGQDYPILGTTQVAPGSWHHAAETYDGQNWRLYLMAVWMP
jgi:hypothetical protein